MPKADPKTSVVTATFEQQLSEWELARLKGGPLPDADRPGLPIWQTLRLLAHESSDYLQTLETAHQVAKSVEDIRLTCSLSMVAAVTDLGTMSRMDVWLERLPGDEVGKAALSDVGTAWMTLGAVAAAVLHGDKVDASKASEAAKRLFELLNSPARVVCADTMVAAGQLLLEYGFSVGRFELLDLVISLTEGPRVMPLASAAARARWFSCRGYLCYMRSDADGAKRCWRIAQTLSEEAQLRGAAFMAQIGLARQLLDEQDFAGADDVLATIRPAEGPGRSTQVLDYKHVLARSLLMKSQPHAALMQVNEALDAASLLGIVDGELFLLMQQKAEILYVLGRHDDAFAQIEWMMARSKGTDRRIHEVNLHLLKGLSAGGAGRQAESVVSFQRAFGEARAWNFTRFLRSLPALASQACLEALRAGIEATFVVDTIRQRQLRAPPDATTQWPWHVVVTTMGHAGVVIDGKPLKFPGRTQAKPLELLYFLASSRGMRASNELIATQLWSDEVDPERAAKSLESTTARLRKALGDASLVLVDQNQTALHAGRTWSDWNGLVSVSSQLSAAANAAVGARDVPSLADELLSVYKGTFLPNLDSVPWASARRREATQIFVAAAISVHSAWPTDRVSRPVEAFLESALLHEPLSEAIALSLMRVYARSDRSADALRVFRHLRQQMSILLGMKPGKAIEALADTLLAGG